MGCRARFDHDRLDAVVGLAGRRVSQDLQLSSYDSPSTMLLSAGPDSV